MMRSMINSPGASKDGGQMMNSTHSSHSLTDVTLEQAILKLQEIDKENIALRDNLRENNAVVKKQYEALSTWRKKEQEKFERTKALITALREENQEHQVNLMAKADREKELTQRIQVLEEEKAHLQRQKVISDQRLINFTKIAAEQGMKGLPSEDIGDFLDDPQAMVFVTTSEKEEIISNLENAVASKEELISQLRTENIKLEHELTKTREATKQLLQDMEAQQRMKQSIEEDNRNLTKQLLASEEKLHAQMKSVIAGTKREMLVGKSSQGLAPHRAAAEENMDDTAFSFPENVDDLMNIAKSLEAKQVEQRSVEELKLQLSENNKAKQAMEKEMDKLKLEFKALSVQHKDVTTKLHEMEAQSKETADRLAQEYELKLMGMAKNNAQDTRTLQASETEDMSILRSQVLTLIREVDEAQNKLSAAMEAINVKDDRIKELEQLSTNLKLEYQRHWQESNDMIQQLRSQVSQYQKSQQENISFRLQHQRLQENFSKLVTDYKELQEMFESYRQQMERQPQRHSKEALEEINRLTAQVIAADEAIAYRDEQIEMLRQRNAHDSQLDEEIQLLKFQADLYKSDFQAEREGRTKLAEEKVKLLEDQEKLIVNIQELQESNRRLKEELDTFNQRQINEMQRRLREQSMHSTLESSNRYQTPPQQSYRPPSTYYMQESAASQQATRRPTDDDDDLQSFQQYECPKCGIKYPDVDSLQLHVPDCIDNP
ncbi:NF-kappa-B essential modulator-like [Physella acuta]|uniref:NF-kappa-B essential modulator-like n=1 Tax=Physella acuta TaxID=109671 RepID=UPI0027DDB4AE|nr:NF-kappa-B essential modulator-like [Physella acuta]XP_059146710.1 NF-kappa-B essential modulator-like [Physella acuta]XP_059146711.1 NF-kappa-B essential modulator-like [Physella acuta]